MNDIVPSPCIRQCTLDNSQVCVGCYRSMDEIIHWASLDNATRRDVLALADSRRRNRTIRSGDEDS